MLRDDDLVVAAHLGQPGAELLGVAHRRRERDHLDVLGEVDDDLLPHRPPEPVGEVVDLVHHHVAETAQGRRPGIHHVAQHLGGHDHHGRLAVDRRVTRQQADLRRPVDAHEVVVLLVGEGLDRGRVERLAAGRQREVDRELPHDGLACAGGSRDQHAPAGLDRLAGPDLEVVEGELQGGEERPEVGLGLLGAPGCGGVPLGGGGHAVRLCQRVRPHPRGTAGAMTVSADGTTSRVSGRCAKRSPSA